MKSFLKSLGIIFVVFSSIAIVICAGISIIDKIKLKKI
ncbi:hypothetical protein J2Z71_001694 [Peptoniphilus stercorisuis]|uniref:Lipoprotein n=1 Tax=Peptoniphilus stercorisuis TaxID=1436965 RepID=A0ABS4KFU8_9FIRM|nr:hypothetical protein [Peptoniphilus stercorisuis]